MFGTLCKECGKELTKYIEDDNGHRYCSKNCYNENLPKCSICKKRMERWLISETGEKYCSENCYENILPKCNICKKPMKKWISDDNGKKYCSDICYKTSWPKCDICGKSINEWIATEEDYKCCSNECFITTCPRCSVCGKHVEKWKESITGEIFCSEQCFENILPKCVICNKPMREWQESIDGKKFCDSVCYEKVLPHCTICGVPMYRWIQLENDNFCSEKCHEIHQNMSKFYAFCNISGLDENDTVVLLHTTKWSIDKAIDEYDKLSKSSNALSGIPIGLAESIRNAGIYDKLSKSLANYNTMRGGAKGFKGFVFEELHAAKSSTKGISIQVLASNGVADFGILQADGTLAFAQAKVGYYKNSIDWSHYKGQTIVVDKGNTQLIESAQKAGLNVLESEVSASQASNLAQAMQFESKITGNIRAPITSKIYSLNQAGLNAAKSGGAFGGGFSIGTNIVDMLSGEKELGDAAFDIAKDTATAAVVSYAAGAVGSAFASTSAGVAVSAFGTTVATATGFASVSTAVTATATAATSALASTSVGVATTGVITVATTVLGTTAIGATIVAAVPLAIAGAALGGTWQACKKLFDR